MEQEKIEKYIVGDASAQDKEEILAWAKADEKNMAELRAMRKLYDYTVWQREETPALAGKRKQRRRILLGSVAAAAACLFVFWGLNNYIDRLKSQIPEIVMQTIRVPAGQRAELTLVDGTQVWLNAGTTFTFPNRFDRNQRQVKLDGEAYFDVKKNESHPFVVSTAEHDVKVLGTQFNMLAYSRSPLYEVSLLEGKVEVAAKNGIERITLNPDFRAYSDKGRLRVGKIENYDYLLWREGLICFDDEPVDRMVSKLELYFDIKIIVENEAFKKKKYTGKFRTKDGVEHILRVFQLKETFTYERDEEKNLITIK
ncbi:FecR domain-containing protein [Parabacteroides sp. OttesenSCG-928-G06]|nr:FecR domain-containing protein [Parabacteroides sp. OttesenSCG-928-K15]MDL2281867.1 FecR domain-containing protein [Parabacteroides sp. OttesenSCG-928-G06]